MAPGGQPPTGVSGAGTQARLWGWGWGADYSRCLSACPPPPDALPTQAAEDGVAVQLQKDSNGFLIAGGGCLLIHLHMLSLFCHLSNSDSRGPGFGEVRASRLMTRVNDRSPFSSK